MPTLLGKSLPDFFGVKQTKWRKNPLTRQASNYYNISGRSNTRVDFYVPPCELRVSHADIPMRSSDAHLLLIWERIIMRLCAAAAAPPTQMNERMNEYVCRVICQLGK